MKEKVQRVKPTDSELQLWSGEHLAYTFTLFKGIVEQYRRERNWVVQMALLETFTVECRNLLEFFYATAPSNPKRFDDAVALDFFEDTKTWESLRESLLTPELEKAKQRISKETTHLTYSRLSGTPPEKQWNLEQIYKDMAEVARLFIENANPATLHPEVKGFQFELFKHSRL